MNFRDTLSSLGLRNNVCVII